MKKKKIKFGLLSKTDRHCLHLWLSRIGLGYLGKEKPYG